MTHLIRWSFLAVGIVIIALAVLLLIKDPNAWSSAIAMGLFGAVQVAASVVLGRMIGPKDGSQ